MRWEACPDVQLAPPGIDRLAWRDCGPGCRELDVGGKGRFFGAMAGRAPGDVPWLALIHDRNGAHDLALYRGDDPVFAARMTKAFGGCLVRPRAVGPNGMLVEVSYRDARGQRRRLLGHEPAGILVAQDDAERPPLESVFADGHRFQTTTRRSLDRDGIPAWTAPPGFLISELGAYRDAIVFTASNGAKSSSVQAWTGRDVQTLAHNAGGPVTDGTDLVWFAEVDGAIALHAHGPTATSRRLRAAHQDFVDAAVGVLGDGLALHVERRHDESEGTLILTRLADGASWAVPRRAGARWGTPLWVTRDELAVVLDPDAGAVRAGTVALGNSMTILRLALDRIAN
ncbi:MAG: hypothetical protein KF773_24290 [Deltaproteobacteria bacterium]|nr:hypothetical protein [Deltaproteobacteria bacterium]